LRRISAQPLEVHRAGRRLRSELAVRGVRQRADRGDGLRRAGCGHQLAGHEGHRGRRHQRPARRTARARGTGRRARAAADGPRDQESHGRRRPSGGRALRAPGDCCRVRAGAVRGDRVTVPATSSPRGWRVPLVVGVALGVVYVLSPLTVWFAGGMALVVRGAGHGTEGTERRWIPAVLLVAIVARVAAVAALFLVTDHARVPFGHFFGDEEYFVRRSIWLRNVGLRRSMHGADLIYAFDDYSQTSYLYVLAFVQVLVGPSPYGVHLLGIGCYVGASALMFRIVRAALGRVPALGGLMVLLFLPSQFAWSVSAL